MGTRSEQEFEKYKDRIYPWVREIPAEESGWKSEGYSPDDTPLLSFADGLMTVFVIRRGEESFDVLKDSMMPEGMTVEELYQTACENLARDVEFVFSNTLFGGFGVIADGIHEASALCLRHIWDVCTEKLKDDVVIMAPSRDLLLFAPKSDDKVIQSMIQFGEQGWARSEHRLTRRLYQYSRERKELTGYERD
nr:hypothetical protein [uncultured Sellimonas sp.]